MLICAHLCLVACLFPVTAHAQETITVAVASSLYPAMQQQAVLFEKKHDVTIRLVPGSTGRLYNQIMQGAPFDLFIAADQERPALLLRHGKSISQHDVGLGYVGLIAGRQPLAGLEQLKSASVRHIAIANPDVAPFGRVTRELLQQQGFWDTLKHKFVYTQNAMQAAMMVNKGLVDAGFIPVASDAPSIAIIRYQGVLLADKPMALLLLKSMAAVQGEPVVSQLTRNP